MDLEAFCNKLTESGIAFERNVTLAPFTSWKIGGPADVLIKLKEPGSLSVILITAKQYQIPLTYLGGGSNVLINDSGIRGVVVKNELTGISIESEEQQLDTQAALDSDLQKQPQARLVELDTENYYDFAALDYQENDAPKVKVKVASGTILAYTGNYLMEKGITGLQWFAGIPGTIGGAVYNNIHGGSHFFSEVVCSVDVIDQEGNPNTLAAKDITFDYDYSSLQHSGYFIVNLELTLFRGDKQKAMQTAAAWAAAKREKQPFNSAGCCFKNLSDEEKNKLQVPSSSWGYLIDAVLGLKGQRRGDAMISLKHAAFIENVGQATSADVMALLDLIYQTAAQKLQGITPKTEIFFLGYTPNEIEKFR